MAGRKGGEEYEQRMNGRSIDMMSSKGQGKGACMVRRKGMTGSRGVGEHTSRERER